MSLPQRALPVLSVASTVLIAAGTFMALTPAPPTTNSVDSAASMRHWSETHHPDATHSKPPATATGTQSSTAPTAAQPTAQPTASAPSTTQAPPPNAADGAT